jgi:Plasmid pRiA4b ORF-3-like protein
MSVKSTTIYQLKIALQGSKPPIWRRVQVQSNITLDVLIVLG